MTDDLKLRQWDRCWPGNINLEVAVDEALARITDLEAKLQRLGRELNLAKYGEPDFAWEIHKNAVADLEARLAAAVEVQDRLMSERYQHYLRAEAAEAGEDALAGWRPIETAPHEELVVLGWQENGVWKQEIALASAGERFPNGYSNMWAHGCATHWMPLPEPPAALLPAGEGEE